MADQIKKIIFTTKEAYYQKAAAGTLDPGVVYAIDASQAVTPTEVKTAVDNGFDKFGLTLGIDETKANFYDLPISLTEMLKDIVKDKVDANYLNDSSVLVVDGRTVKIAGVYRNTIVNVKQNGTDFGMFKYTLKPTVEEDGSEATSRVATIELPTGVDLTKEFDVVLSNVFGTKTHTVNFAPTFETVAKNKLDEIVGRFYFDEAPRVYINEYSYGELGNFDYQVKYFENTDSGKEYFKNNVSNILSPFGVAFIAIPDKSLITSDILEKIRNISADGNYTLITNLDMTEYFDSVKNVWATMPTDKNEAIAKIYGYCGYYFNRPAINKTKTDEAISRANLTTINNGSRYDALDTTIASGDEEQVRAAEVINCFTNDSTEAFVDSLISLNNTRPLTTKVIVFPNHDIDATTLNKLATLNSLQVVEFVNRTSDYLAIPENFKPLLINTGEHKLYIEPVKGKVSTYVEIPESVKSIIGNI